MSRQTQMNIPITDSLEEETMHLFDAEARKEVAFCGAKTSADDRTSLQYYEERRRHSLTVGTVCEPCKDRSVAFARRLCREFVAEGRSDEAEVYRCLADTLAKETGMNR